MQQMDFAVSFLQHVKNQDVLRQLEQEVAQRTNSLIDNLPKKGDEGTKAKDNDAKVLLKDLETNVAKGSQKDPAQALSRLEGKKRKKVEQVREVLTQWLQKDDASLPGQLNPLHQPQASFIETDEGSTALQITNKVTIISTSLGKLGMTELRGICLLFPLLFLLAAAFCSWSIAIPWFLFGCIPFALVCVSCL